MTAFDAQCKSIFSVGHVIATALNAQASGLSLISIIIFLFTVGVKYRQNCISPPNGGEWRLLRSNLDAYMLNLLAAEAVRAIAGLIDLKWAVERGVTCGHVCSVEGALRVVGFTATAWFSAAIAVQTWLSVYRNQQPGTAYSLRTWLSFSAFVWAFMSLFALLGWVTHRRDGLPGDGSDFYQPTPFLCSIKSEYRVARIVGEYLWIWLCSFGTIVLYVPLYLYSRGNLEFWGANGKVHHTWHFPAPSVGSHEYAQDQQEVREDAWKMLLYPAAYTFEILGLSIVRSFVDKSKVSLADDPTLGGYAAPSLFFGWVSRLSGLINVILILTTRPNILLYGSRGALHPDDPRLRGKNQEASNDSQSEAGREGS